MNINIVSDRFKDLYFLKEVLPELLKKQYCKENNLGYIEPIKVDNWLINTPIDQRLYFS